MTVPGPALLLGDSITVGYAPLLSVAGSKTTVAKVGATSSGLLEALASVPSGSYATAFVLAGTNDLGGGASAQSIAANVLRIVEFARSRGARVFLMTVPPFKGWANYTSRFDAIETKRLALNGLLRSAAASLPGVVLVPLDVEAADPTDRAKLAPAFDSGDHLHPNPRELAKLLGRVGSIPPSPSTPSTPGTPGTPVSGSAIPVLVLGALGLSAWLFRRGRSRG